MATGTDTAEVVLWRAKGGEAIARFRGDTRIVNCIAPHPGGGLLAVSGLDCDVKWASCNSEKAVFGMEPSLEDSGEDMDEGELESFANLLDLGVNQRALLQQLLSRLIDFEGGNGSEESDDGGIHGEEEEEEGEDTSDEDDGDEDLEDVDEEIDADGHESDHRM